jgi:CRP/FNR family cyclic AMP-dependent transcriptional regulator
MATGQRVTRGTTVVRAGDSTDALYIILSGTAKVMIADNEGREVIFAMLGPGEFFGEMGLIDGEPRSADVVAAETCELVVILKEDFRRCLADNFEVTLHIMKNLVHRLRDANRKIESLALMDVYGRVAKLLLELSQSVDGRRVIARRLTKQDIAKMVGASREMVSRVMKDLETRGYIVVEGGHVFLPEE